MTRFKGKYRTESSWLTHWDYSWPGLYFVTVCTANKICWFGEVVDGKMVDSNFGSIARKQWEKSFAIRKELKCHAFVLMPNHLHAIVELVIPQDDGGRRGDLGVNTHGPPLKLGRLCVSTTAKFTTNYKPVKRIPFYKTILPTTEKIDFVIYSRV